MSFFSLLPGVSYLCPDSCISKLLSPKPPMGCTVLSVTETEVIGNLTLAMVIFYLDHLSTLLQWKIWGNRELLHVYTCTYAYIYTYIHTSICVGEKRLGNLLDDYVTVKNVTSNNTLNDTFIFFFRKIIYGNIVMKMMKRPQDICKRYFSRIASYMQNLQNKPEFCSSIYLS